MAMSKLKLKKIKVPEKAERMMEEGPVRFPPSFHVDGTQMSEIKDLDPGTKYKFVIEVEMSSKSDRKEKVSAEFEIRAYRLLKKKTPQEMNDKEFEEYQGRVLGGKEV